MDLAAAIGAPHFVGPMYSAVGKTRMLEPAEREAQRVLAVESLKVVADYAAERDVRLAIEPLNRFETDLVNTAEQVLELLDRVAAENVGVLLDTFHMNIDEKSLGDAIRLVGERLLQLHTCENDRGTPGTGHVPWGEVFDAVQRHRLHRPARHRVLHARAEGDRQGREPVAPAGCPERRARAQRRSLPARVAHAGRDRLKRGEPSMVRVAMIGLGFGAEFIPIYQRHPQAELAAICRRDRAGLDEVGDQFGVAKRYTDYRELLAGPRHRRRPHQLADPRPRVDDARGAQGRQARRLHGADGDHHRGLPAGSSTRSSGPG